MRVPQKNSPVLVVYLKKEKNIDIVFTNEGLMKVIDMLNSSIGKTKDAPASGSTPAS